MKTQARTKGKLEVDGRKLILKQDIYYSIADIHDTDSAEGKANAEYLARAWNCFDDFKVILEDAIVNIKTLHKDDCSDAPHDEGEFCVYCQWVRNAEQALNNAS